MPSDEDRSPSLVYKLGAAAAVGVVALVPVQIAVYVRHPPPSTVEGFFTLFRESPLVGLLGLDLLYLVTMAVMPLVYLALYFALRRTSPGAMAIALVVELLATAVYFPTNPAFEMLSLSEPWSRATSEAERAVFLGAGEALLATYKGTAFDVSYVGAAIGGIVIAVVMRRSRLFGRTAPWVGLAANVLGLVPSTAGTPGFVLSFASLPLLVVWLVLVARRLLALAREAPLRPARTAWIGASRAQGA